MSTLYDDIGRGYARHRQPDPRLAARIDAALGNARTVVNVGAGAGSYEPADRDVTAVEPSATMIAQRPPGAAPTVQARAEALPFEDGAFDAALAVLTVHHWGDWRRGVTEMRRVAGRVVVLTWDPAFEGFWLTRDYLPEVLAADRRDFPPIGALAEALGGADVQTVPVPHDCVDGFGSAYWRQPEAYLDPAVRAATSMFARAGSELQSGLKRLEADLASGAWNARYGHVLALDEADLGFRLVTSRAA